MHLPCDALVAQWLTPRCVARMPRALVMSLGEVDTLTLTLKGCESGIGVGLDKENKVDMLREGSPASKVLQKGDVIITWDGIDMMGVEGGRKVQRKLIDVAPDPLKDEYTVIIERPRTSWSSTSWQQTDATSWDSKPDWEKTGW